MNVRAGRRTWTIAAACALLLAVAGCSSTPQRPAPEPRSAEKPVAGIDKSAGAQASRPGGYYLDDGPGANPPPDIASIADAVPRPESPLPRANKPYSAFGVDYVPDLSGRPYLARGIASWYGRRFHGMRTSSGERYDMYAMTAAHPTLPIPSYARVTNQRNGRSVIVRINDRGPFLRSRIIDLSYAAAAKLGYINRGSTPVEVESVVALPPSTTASNSRPPNDATTTTAPIAVARADPPPQAVARPAVPRAALPQAAIPQATISQAAVPQATIPQAALAQGEVSTAPTSNAPSDESSMPAGLAGPTVAAATPARAEQDNAGFWVQLGAFASFRAAESLCARASALRADGEPNALVASNSGLHRVRVGPYRSRDAASTAADRLGRVLGVSPRVGD